MLLNFTFKQLLFKAYIVPLRLGKGIVAAEDRLEDGYVVLSVERRVGAEQAIHHHPGRP